MKHYLLTWHGHFIGSQSNSAIRLQPGEILDIGQLLCIDVSPSFSPDSFSAFLANAPPASQQVTLPGIGTFSIRPQNYSNVVALEQNGRYLCALPDGTLVSDRTQVLSWERFLIVSDQSLQQLQQIMADSWIIASNRRYIDKDEILIDQGHNLVVGPLTLPLGENLPFEAHFAPFRFPVHPNGWKFDQIILYRPLVFYVAFGEDAIEQLSVSMSSLCEIGKYDGSVLVFTDVPEDELRKRLVKIARCRLRVALPPPANERVGFVASRYAILEDELAHQCAPVVYMDTDIVYNADIRQLIVDMVCAGRPSAPLEHFSNLATSPSVGAELIREDNGNPILASGFNNGTFAVPNLKEFGHVLAIIRRTLQNYLSLNGRGALAYSDQEVANYISYKFANFDTSQVSRYVRYGWTRDASTLGVLSGLVHFCGVPRESRLASMQRYLDLLIDHYDSECPSSQKQRSLRSVGRPGSNQ